MLICYYSSIPIVMFIRLDLHWTCVLFVWSKQRDCLQLTIAWVALVLSCSSNGKNVLYVHEVEAVLLVTRSSSSQLKYWYCVTLKLWQLESADWKIKQKNVGPILIPSLLPPYLMPPKTILFPLMSYSSCFVTSIIWCLSLRNDTNPLGKLLKGWSEG